MSKQLWFAVLILATVSAFAQSAPAEKPKNASRRIKSAGCTEPGVEGGCMVLRGYKDHKQYNLFFPSGKKPAMDIAISFTGTEHHGPTTCMQGLAVDVAKWTPLKMKCEKATSPTN